MSALALRKQIRLNIVRYCNKYMSNSCPEYVKKFIADKTDESMRARLKIVKGGKSDN